MSFWRREDPVIEETRPGFYRVVKGGMWPHQRKWWDLQNYVRLLVAGYGAGKSEMLCKWSIAAALHNAPVPSAIVSPSFPQARKTVIPTLEKLLEGKRALRSDFTFEHHKTEHVFRLNLECRPAGYLYYLSGDKPESLKGTNLGTAAIDEPFIQDFKVFEQLAARTRDPSAKVLAIGMAGTPEELNWGWELAEGDLRDRYDVGFLSAGTRENLVLPKSYAERLERGFDSRAADAYLRGKFVSLSSGRVFHAFARDLNVATVPKQGTHFVGMDFNVNPMAFVIGWHNADRCHIYAEYELPNSDTEYAASLIRESHPEVRIAFPDPSGKRRSTNAPGGMSDFKHLTKSGFVVLAPNDQWPLRDSYNSVNARFFNRSLTIDPACKKLIGYLQAYAHETKTKQESMSHLLDAFRYAVTYLYPAYRPSTMTTHLVGA